MRNLLVDPIKGNNSLWPTCLLKGIKPLKFVWLPKVVSEVQVAHQQVCARGKRHPCQHDLDMYSSNSWSAQYQEQKKQGTKSLKDREQPCLPFTIGQSQNRNQQMAILG